MNADCQANQTENEKTQVSRIQEIVVPQELQKELDIYQQTLDTIYQDNTSNPNSIAEIGILELRKHNECLREICYEAFLKCTKDLSSEKVFSQGYGWCDAKLAEMDLIDQTKLYYVITQNQSRKEVSLQKQKWGALETRSRQYFHHWISKFVNDFRTFVEKVFNFITTPVS